MKNLYDKIHRDFNGLRMWSNDCHIKGLNALSSQGSESAFAFQLTILSVLLLIKTRTIIIPEPKKLPKFNNSVRLPPW